eukprot:CAMPEP_0182854436 /NCGR_PEP_ID=MMETSP0034_2-20130328/1250_1 /TAXON_ID=156128 /ORGANISM="Nephroselmis pyriformis, Strain CCMP717" /LENGTH=145 /DNA_ID=CAMNT_0024985267 /DNA_START=155 /DNA_END=592 /DNA_ORIENTATION=+
MAYISGADIAEIIVLVNSFDGSIDRGVPKSKILQLFTEDAVVIDKLRNLTSRGRDEVGHFIDQVVGAVQELPTRPRHSITTHMVWPGSDANTAHCSAMLTALMDCKVIAVGQLDDTLKKINGKWKLNRREISVKAINLSDGSIGG